MSLLRRPKRKPNSIFLSFLPRGILIFIFAALFVGLGVGATAIWILVDPGANIPFATLDFLSVSDVLEGSEPVVALLSLIVGAAISLSGALVAIYLASIASNIQRQQFELELMSFLDREFQQARAAFAARKRVMIRLHDFTMRRDHVLQEAIEKFGGQNSGPTLEQLAEAARQDDLPQEMLATLSALSEAAIAEQESQLAAQLRQAGFSAHIEEFEATVRKSVDDILENLRISVSKPNREIGGNKFSESQVFPDRRIEKFWEEKITNLKSVKYLPIFSEMKAKITPELIVKCYVTGYNLAASDSGGRFQFSAADFATRNVLNGMGSVLAFDTYQYVKVGLDIKSRHLAVKGDVHKNLLVASGLADLLRLLLSNPSNDAISLVIHNYSKDLLPSNAKMSNSLRRFINDRIFQMQSVATELFDHAEIEGENFSIPSTVFNYKKEDSQLER